MLIIKYNYELFNIKCNYEIKLLLICLGSFCETVIIKWPSGKEFWWDCITKLFCSYLKLPYFSYKKYWLNKNITFVKQMKSNR